MTCRRCDSLIKNDNDYVIFSFLLHLTLLSLFFFRAEVLCTQPTDLGIILDSSDAVSRNWPEVCFDRVNGKIIQYALTHIYVRLANFSPSLGFEVQTCKGRTIRNNRRG